MDQNEAARAAAAVVNDVEIELQKNTIAELRRILLLGAQNAKDILAKTPTEYDSYYLPKLQQAIQEALAEIGEHAAQVVTSAAATSQTLGTASVTLPFEAAGISIVSNISIDTLQLEKMNEFLTYKMKDISTKIVNTINSELALTAIGAQTPYQAAAKIAGITDSAHKRGTTIVRTELGRIYSMAADERMRSAAEAVPGLKKQWRRSGKPNARIQHDAADGQTRLVKEKFRIANDQLDYPRDPKAPAKQTINCGCTMIPYFEDWSMLNPHKEPFTRTELRNEKKQLMQGSIALVT